MDQDLVFGQEDNTRFIEEIEEISKELNTKE